MGTNLHIVQKPVLGIIISRIGEKAMSAEVCEKVAFSSIKSIILYWEKKSSWDIWFSCFQKDKKIKLDMKTELT